MIGSLNPAAVFVQTSFITAPGGATVYVRSTSVATEQANDLAWLQNN